jgi:hypothetical protein
VSRSYRTVAILSRAALVAPLVGLGTAAAQTENGFDFGATQRTRSEVLDPQFRALRLEAPRDGWIGSGWRDTTGAAATTSR